MKVTQAMVKRAMDQKIKQNVEKATEGGINILTGVFQQDFSGIKKGFDKIQTVEIDEQDEKMVA